MEVTLTLVMTVRTYWPIMMELHCKQAPKMTEEISLWTGSEVCMTMYMYVCVCMQLFFCVVILHVGMRYLTKRFCDRA